MLIETLYVILAIVCFLVALKFGSCLGSKLSEMTSLTVALPIIIVLLVVSIANDDLSGPMKVFMGTFVGFAGALCASAAWNARG